MRRKIDIKAAVSDGKFVRFTHYVDGNLWYCTDDGDEFPVPVSDVGTATFKVTDKAILFMRYMRKFNESFDDAMRQDW